MVKLLTIHEDRSALEYRQCRLRGLPRFGRCPLNMAYRRAVVRWKHTCPGRNSWGMSIQWHRRSPWGIRCIQSRAPDAMHLRTFPQDRATVLMPLWGSSCPGRIQCTRWRHFRLDRYQASTYSNLTGACLVQCSLANMACDVLSLAHKKNPQGMPSSLQQSQYLMHQNKSQRGTAVRPMRHWGSNCPGSNLCNAWIRDCLGICLEGTPCNLTGDCAQQKYLKHTVHALETPWRTQSLPGTRCSW